MGIKDTARGYLRDAIGAFNRAPTEVALAVFAAVLLSIAIEHKHQFETWLQFAVASFMALCFAWTGTLLHAMRAIPPRVRWIITLAGAVCAALYVLLVGDIQRQAEMWRALMLVAAAALLAFAAPAWIDRDEAASLRLRRINGRILLRTIGIALYGLALFGGLALALAAIDNLFELDLRSQIYGHVFGWIMLVLVPWVIVGGIDDYLEPLDVVSDVARVVQRLSAFLVPPLLALYYVILVAYAGRILVTGELPKNLVSPMVLAAGLLTALAVILFDPAPHDARVGQRALRWAPVLFLLLSPLGMWALYARIDQYGWTEFRLLRVVLLVLLALLAIFATVQVVRRRPFGLRVLPAVLGLALALGAVGPWSVLAIARRDQQSRLRSALREAHVDPRQVVQDTTRREVPRQIYERINSVAVYLRMHHGEDALAAVVGAHAHDPLRGWSLADNLGLRPALDGTGPAMPLHGSLSPHARVETASGTLYRVQAPSPNVRMDGRYLVLDYGAVNLRVAADPIIRHMLPVRVPKQRGLPAVPWPALDADQQTRGELIIFDAAFEQAADTLKVLRLDGVLLIR